MKKKIGQRIRYFRKLKQWSQEKLALNANMNPAFIGHLERGLKSPTVSTLEKISSALGVTISELFNEQEIVVEQNKQISIDKIIYAVRNLSIDDIDKIANIVIDIVELKNNSK